MIDKYTINCNNNIRVLQGYEENTTGRSRENDTYFAYGIRGKYQRENFTEEVVCNLGYDVFQVLLLC